MKCDICRKKVTPCQLKHAEAIKTATGYTHTDCIDDLSRPEDDAYHRDAKDYPTPSPAAAASPPQIRIRR